MTNSGQQNGIVTKKNFWWLIRVT